MVRTRRIIRKPRAKKQEEYDSDDTEAEAIPDKKSAAYVEDKIDEFHNVKISHLLARGVQEDSDEEDEDKAEEVLPLTLSDSENDDDDEEEEEVQEENNEEDTDMESDLEGQKDDDLPNDMAWGDKKNIFYNSDYVTIKGKSFEEIEAEDKEEEEEAKNIQRRLAANLSEEDYDLNLLEEFAAKAEEEKEVEKEEKIVKDFKTMSQKEKLKLLKKESPELLELIQDFKVKLTELRDEVQPLVEMVKDGRIPPGKHVPSLACINDLFADYAKDILGIYCNAVCVQLINELGAVDARLAPQLRQLLFGEKPDKTARRSAKVSEETELVEAEESDLDEEANLRFYNAMVERQKLKRKKIENQDGLVEEEGMEGNAKRGITYQMSKNKGLTPKRKKIDRNPRVKHREKFRRAQIRRKGQVREVRREETRYSGEWSGIRAGVKRSVKLK
ncbi:Something about silencing protein 10 [Anabarilius grahami]|uniref:Something about silencing protein 10 n=1 Tax=Anabarilius grahami TaxID=495550 RepID=A0A3N0XGH3_ANAGA|nr:Something about silencing protein 10 [Anabarilius grahami]